MLIGYVTVGTNNLLRAMSFYDALFENTGFNRMMEMPGMAAWGARWDQSMFSVIVPFDGQPASAGNGCMIALALESRAMVRSLHARALDLGGVEEGAPKALDPASAHGFYASYLRDLDGNMLCFHSIGPAED